MYNPKHFKEESLEHLYQLIEDNNFATVITQHQGELLINHYPLILEREIGTKGRLIGHMARANPQWKNMVNSDHIQIIFQGAHAYVSPTWYDSPNMVPTWNYAVVHVHGKARLIEESDALLGILNKLIQVHEAPISTWSANGLTEEKKAGLLKVIIGFEITITEIEGKFKLSQNRSEQDQKNAIEQLTKSENALDHQVGEMMKTRGNF